MTDGLIIRATLPSGFALADEAQQEIYQHTGAVPGARKLYLVSDPDGGADLAVRLGPPKAWSHVISDCARREARISRRSGPVALEWYLAEYERGWRDGRRGGGYIGPNTSAPYDDGLLDGRAERPKWHTTFCTSHPCGNNP